MPLRHLFLSEAFPAARDFLRERFCPEWLYDDVRARPTTGWPQIDLYNAGPPCQSFSQAGGRRGMKDERGVLLWSAFEFIEEAKPRVALLENVPRLRTVQGGGPFRQILARLGAAGYRVTHGTANSRAHGVPQNRNRLYILALLQGPLGGNCGALKFPRPVPMMKLSEVLDGSRPEVDPRSAPGADQLPPVAAAGVRLAASRRAEGDDWDWVVDDQMSRRWLAKIGRPKEWAPCLINSRRQGLWVGSRGRRLTLAEGCRLHGLAPELLPQWKVPERLAWRLLGNTMTCSVVQRLLCAALALSHPELQLVDHWATGAAHLRLASRPCAGAARTVEEQTVVSGGSAGRGRTLHLYFAVTAAGHSSPPAAAEADVREGPETRTDQQHANDHGRETASAVEASPAEHGLARQLVQDGPAGEQVPHATSGGICDVSLGPGQQVVEVPAAAAASAAAAAEPPMVTPLTRTCDRGTPGEAANGTRHPEPPTGNGGVEVPCRGRRGGGGGGGQRKNACSPTGQQGSSQQPGVGRQQRRPQQPQSVPRTGRPPPWRGRGGRAGWPRPPCLGSGVAEESWGGLCW